MFSITEIKTQIENHPMHLFPLSDDPRFLERLMKPVVDNMRQLIDSPDINPRDSRMFSDLMRSTCQCAGNAYNYVQRAKLLINLIRRDGWKYDSPIQFRHQVNLIQGHRRSAICLCLCGQVWGELIPNDMRHNPIQSDRNKVLPQVHSMQDNPREQDRTQPSLQMPEVWAWRSFGVVDSFPYEETTMRQM